MHLAALTICRLIGWLHSVIQPRRPVTSTRISYQHADIHSSKTENQALEHEYRNVLSSVAMNHKQLWRTDVDAEVEEPANDRGNRSQTPRTTLGTVVEMHPRDNLDARKPRHPLKRHPMQ